ncbi:Hypothetical predicted protein [Podarcis lilfordi]|uniref:Uncharacterized protein n=1 Tax=Podarcis lilfordi TaxID=74358 RepID=A0AA35K4K6_9SAUR|nr:Hypothetical predicted protein [Podarcis lilfordi]
MAANCGTIKRITKGRHFVIVYATCSNGEDTYYDHLKRLCLPLGDCVLEECILKSLPHKELPHPANQDLSLQS